MHTDLGTLATALYCRIDDELKASSQLNRWRPKVGIAPRITDAELITVSVMQVLLRYPNESQDDYIGLLDEQLSIPVDGSFRGCGTAAAGWVVRPGA